MFRQPLHPGDKTDDNDLEAIFHAAIDGYGLASLPVSEMYQSLQSLSRHRHNLVKQRSRLETVWGFRASDIYQGGENEPFKSWRQSADCNTEVTGLEHSKNYPTVVALNLRAVRISQTRP